MKKIYSIVLMAALLFVGTNSWATTHQVGSAEALISAWQNANSGDVIQLTGPISLENTLWLGTTSKTASSKSITLDLNGNVLENTANQYMFFITHGELKVITSVAGGKILHSGHTSKGAQETFSVMGSDTYDGLVNPKTAESGYFSHLLIGEGVYVHAQKQNAIVVKEFTLSSGKLPFTPAGMNAAPAINYSSSSYAYGVRVDVLGSIEGEKYAFKANGNLQAPTDTAAINRTPFIRLYGSADLRVPATNNDPDLKDKKPVAVYCSGYARWLIEGTCVGSTAVYVKSGDVDINDATIQSNYTGTYTPPTGTKSGVTGAGSAIVVESNAAYAGEIDVTISGDSKVTATNGYAIDEKVTTTDTTKVNAVAIEGGTLEGGIVGGTAEEPVYGTITISEKTAQSAAGQDTEKTEKTSITVGGGNIVGAVVEEGSSKTTEEILVDLLPQDESGATSHVTVVTDPETGKQTMVISDGAPVPASQKDKEEVAGVDSLVIDWKHLNDADKSDMNETLEADQIINELVINQNEYNQTLTIGTTGEGAKKVTIKIGSVTLGNNAKIIVNPGSKLIITGKSGIYSPSADNLVLKTSEDEQAIFLIKPVEGGTSTHPNASVEFVSKSYRVDGSNMAWQRFGVPTYGHLTGISAKKGDANIATAFAAYNYATYDWDVIGYISDGADLLKKLGEKAFDYYQMLNNTPTPGTVVRFEGELYGNSNPSLNAPANAWCGFANNYMAPIDGEVLIDMFPAGSVDKAYYLYYIDAETEQWGWYPQSFLDHTNINPMQPFLLRNAQPAAGNVSVDYAEAVYYPVSGETKPSAAAGVARRRVANDITKAKLIVKGENGGDRVIVAEGEEFSAEFDNGYDAVKYMNENVNMYVTADEKMGIFATDNLENTYVGFQTVNGGNYTISFANVQGEEMTLIDHETGARVAMVEGNAYEFTAAANSVNDYRFEIVESAKLPTAIDNTEAVKSAKGIYTVTGQYLGEMNVWNTLPAGVYVINGEKRVK